jgi:hypothetical protein
MTMQLSEAMELGHMQKTFDSNQWLSADGSCGCAFSGALLAIGKGQQFIEQLPNLGTFGAPLETAIVKQEWPWLTYEHLKTISVMAHAVERGETPIEDIWAYVRSIEPAPSPSFSDSFPQQQTVHQE